MKENLSHAVDLKLMWAIAQGIVGDPSSGLYDIAPHLPLATSQQKQLPSGVQGYH